MIINGLECRSVSAFLPTGVGADSVSILIQNPILPLCGRVTSITHWLQVTFAVSIFRSELTCVR